MATADEVFTPHDMTALFFYFNPSAHCVEVWAILLEFNFNKMAKIG